MEVKVDLIKSCLRNICLISVDFKEQVTPEDVEEVRRLEKLMDERERFSPYENHFYYEILNRKMTTFSQIYFYTRQILHELAREHPGNEDDLDIDREKAKLVMKELSEKDIELLKTIYDFEFKVDILDPDFEDRKFLRKLKKVFPKMERLMDAALI